MEWFYRLALEPRRNWRRYLIGNAVFLMLIFKEKIRYFGLAPEIRISRRVTESSVYVNQKMKKQA
jgi:hypothetical protein